MSVELTGAELNVRACNRCRHRPRPCAGPCPCAADPQSRNVGDLAAMGACPLGYHGPAAPAPPAPDPATAADPMAGRGPEFWGELHRRPPAYAGDAAAESEWLAAFARRLPCGACRGGFLSLCAADPPDLSLPAAYAAWTWRIHQAVNEKLSKPPVPWAEACCAWNWPTHWKPPRP